MEKAGGSRLRVPCEWLARAREASAMARASVAYGQRAEESLVCSVDSKQTHRAGQCLQYVRSSDRNEPN